ncbi:MAG: hypothetical protein R6V62_09285 [Candidatus Fermentibacteraceae bacterium]
MNRSLFICAAAFLLTACSNFTEYSGTPSAGLLILDPDSFEILGTLDGIEGGRALCAGFDLEFFVSSTSGELHIYNASTVTRDTSLVIGPGSSAGYGGMAYIPMTNSVYVIGALGTILEVDMDDYAVTDEFTAGSSPAFIIPSRSFDFVYITDPLANKVHAVRTTSNTVQKTWLLAKTPTVMCENTMGSDTLLISTNDPRGVAYVQPADFSSPARKVNLAPASDMARSDFLNLMFTAHPRYGYPTGTVSIIDSLFPAFSVRNTVTIPGNPAYVTTHNDGLHLLILSTGESDGCTLYSYHLALSSFVNSVDLPGTPVDMIMAGNRLVILTY